MGPNLPVVNEMIRLKDAEGEAACISCTIGGQTWSIKSDILVCTDTAALRHCEHMAVSG